MPRALSAVLLALFASCSSMEPIELGSDRLPARDGGVREGGVPLDLEECDFRPLLAELQGLREAGELEQCELFPFNNGCPALIGAKAISACLTALTRALIPDRSAADAGDR